MKKFKKYIFAFLLIGIFVLTGCSKEESTSTFVEQALPEDYRASDLNLDVKAAMAYDVKNGQVLYAHNAKQKMPVASMSKLITIYLTLDAIKNERISWDQKVTPTKQILKVGDNPDFASVPLKKGHSYTVRQLYQATLIQSANNAAMMLAQAVAGNQQTFVLQMRKQLKDWGIENAQIYTPSGLANSTLGPDSFKNADKDAENELSAYDMAIITKHLLIDFPQVIDTTKIAHLDFVDGNTKTKMANWNWMLKGMAQYDANFPLDGIKTGTTDAAGACFTGTMMKNGRRIVTVVMGARHQDGSDPSRFVQTKKLLAYLFNHYQLYILKKDQPISGMQEVSVKGGKIKQTKVVLQKDTGIWLTTNQKLNGDFSSNKIKAPVNKGQNIGNIYLKDIPAINVHNCVALPATVNQDIKSGNVFEKIFN